jgi:Protein of unknown function (DUF2442)
MRIRDVKYLENYSLELTFWDGEKRFVDLTPYVGNGEIFAPLKDLGYFQKVQIDDSQLTICWPNGADFCPDVLHQISKPSKKVA